MMKTSHRGVLAFGMACALLSGCAVSTTQPSPAPAPVFVPAPAAAAPVAPPPPAPVSAPASPDSPYTAQKGKGKTVKLWYGTNRKATQPFVRFDPYGSARDQQLNYGVCEVLVPASHVRGSLGSYSVFHPEKDAPLVFTHATRLEAPIFWSELAATLKDMDSREKVVLVFIHGYNNSFKDAAIRTAQLWADLNLKGVPAFFSWPSRGKVAAYTADEATIDYSEKYLEEFLVRLREEVGQAQPIHVIAHSMGNRALLRVATKLKDKLRFGQIILAAPDVDADLFHDMADAYKGISQRTTVYVSRKDKPVNSSKLLHDMERVGAPPGFVKVEQIDTVEVVAKTGLLELGHAYFAEFSPLLDEIGDLILSNPRRDRPYPGQRLDKRDECARSVNARRTMESCWRIKVKN